MSATEETAATTEGGRRERKQTTFFSVAAAAPAKKPLEETPEGTGLLLADYEFFVEKLGKLRSDDDVVKGLHQLMYGTPGKKTETKKNLRAFRGFPTDSNIEDKVAKIIEKKKVWTVALLKNALELFGCEKSGDRDSLCARLIHYLANPENLKKLSGTKRKASSSAGGKKTKKSKRAKKSKGVSRVSGFLLFSKASRPVLKEKKPELTFAEVGTELGRLWKSLSEEEQKEWNDQAVEVNRAVAEGNSNDSGNHDDDNNSDDDDNSDDNEEEEDEEEKSTGSEDDLFGDDA